MTFPARAFESVVQDLCRGLLNGDVRLAREEEGTGRDISAECSDPPIVIAVMGLKGGVGKSTFLFCASQLIADSGHNVAIIDCDLETSSITREANKRSSTVKTVYEHLTELVADATERTQSDDGLVDITPYYLETRKRGSILLLPASSPDTFVPWEFVASIPQRARSNVLVGALRAIVKRVQSHVPRVSVIAIDCGASSNPLALAALTIADYSFLIVTPEPAYFSALDDLSKLIKQHYPEYDANRMRIVVNRVRNQAEIMRAKTLNACCVPFDASVALENFEGGSIDYDIGYNPVFQAVRACLADSVGQRHPNVIPDEVETRIRPWYAALLERGLAAKILSSRQFHLKTWRLWIQVSAECVALGIFTSSFADLMIRNVPGRDTEIRFLGLMCTFLLLVLGFSAYRLLLHTKEQRFLHEVLDIADTSDESARQRGRAVLGELLLFADPKFLLKVRANMERTENPKPSRGFWAEGLSPWSWRLGRSAALDILAEARRQTEREKERRRQRRLEEAPGPG
jgi:cellulose biosynthesis protein BcsQ